MDNVINQYPSKNFNGSQIYSSIKNTNFNDYLTFDNKEYYKLINNSFSDYSFDDSYILKSFDDLCISGEYSLKQQQQFAGRIFNTHVDNRGMLIYHGLGSGKTQTSIVIAEGFKHKTTSGEIIPGRAASYILIVVPSSLTEQYFNELIGVYYNKKIKSASGEILIFGKRQYYLDPDIIDALDKRYKNIQNLNKTLFELKEKGDLSKINDIENKIVENNNGIRTLKDIGSKNVKKVYEILSHDTFLNGLFKGPNFTPERYLERLKINNGLLIIDEAHRLVSALGTNYRRLLFGLKFHANTLFRTVLLSGSPIYDKPYEFGLLMNLLRPRIPFPDGPDEFNKYFIDSETGNLKNEELFKMMTLGYVSYFKGGNPNAYPYKKIILCKSPMGIKQYPSYKKVLFNEIKRDQDISTTFGKNYDDFMYKTSNSNNNEEAVSVYNNARLYCNIVFPELTESLDFKGTKQTRKKLFTKEILDNFSKFCREIFIKDGKEGLMLVLEEYSSKFVKIVKLVESSPGPVFIYSNYVNYGVDPLGIIFSSIGYKLFTGKSGNNSYFIWKGSSDKNLVESAKKIFNSEANADGSKIKIIFGTQTTMEGVDFKRVRQVHIIDPWWNDSRIQQIMARAVRLCSHTGLSESQRITDIFIHLSTLGDSIPYFKIVLKDSRVLTSDLIPNKDGLFRSLQLKFINNELINVLEKNEYFSKDQIESFSNLGDPSLFGVIGTWKQLNVNSVEEYMYLKSTKKLNLNRQFENAIKSVSIDCEINKAGNITRLEEHYEPFNSEIYSLYYENYSTGERYIRSGIHSKSLPEGLITLSDLLDNLPRKSDIYVFKKIGSNEVVVTDKSLVVLEDIPCSGPYINYSFNSVPLDLKNITINNSLIKDLMSMDIRIIKNFLKNSMDRSPNSELSKKLFKFIKQSDYTVKQSLINKLKELGVGDSDTPWELLDISELKLLIASN